jgi:glycosyltransferase involved in cell wall biosynthesis
MRVLVISHGHPGESPAGGEHAAYEMFKALGAIPEFEPFFLARTGIRRHATTPFATWEGRSDEVLVHSDQVDLFLHSLQSDTHLFEWEALLRRLRPDIVHFHHYIGLGVELIALARRVLPHSRIVVTLHEFAAICHHYGQMVRTGSHSLCERASARLCAECFPERTRSDFAMRRIFLLSHFEKVDWFVAPSLFLRDRYISWGLPATRIVVIENYLPPIPRVPPRPLAPSHLRNRFGYFGTVGVFKGIQVLVEGFERFLLTEMGRGAELVIHGMLGFAPDDFRSWFDKALARNVGHMRWVGRYHRGDLSRLMADIDWVVVPSIWWENSPLIIQEAKMLGRPIICSGIGGMREKVRDGEDGLLFEPGDPDSLATAMSLGVPRFESLQELLAIPSMSDHLAEIIALYSRDLRSGNSDTIAGVAEGSVATARA